jgi:hypothetical protein
MADWAGVKEALNSRYATDFGMKLLAGADDKPFVTIAGIIGNTTNYNIQDLLSKMDLFGLRIAGDNLILSHWAVLETIDLPELIYPIELMAKRLAALR